MAEMKASNVLIVVVLVGVVGLVGAAYFGYVDLFGLNKKNIEGLMDKGAAAVSGFSPAKSPQEAMDKFREAIEARKYKTAATYCTKPYADMLERSAVGAAELGGWIDTISRYSKDKQLFTDKTTFLLFRLDPFPRVLKSGPAPTEKNGKTYGTYVWEEPKITTPPNKLAEELLNVDPKMFQFFLAREAIFKNPIELVKEGDVWKLSIPVDPGWESFGGYFNDNWKTYNSALEGFNGTMTNNRWDTPRAFEGELVEKLRSCKKPS